MDIKITAPDVVRITIGNWQVWIDDSTNEKIITQYTVEDKKEN